MYFMAPISNRGILSLRGTDAKKFLQGLITNDIHHVSDKRAIYTALLAPQGKFLHDFFITEKSGVLFLEVEKERLADLKKRLMLYKLKADVDIEDVSACYQIWAFWGENVENKFGLSLTLGEALFDRENIFYVDPRWAMMGVRGLLYMPQKSPNEQINLEPQALDTFSQNFISQGFQIVEFDAYDYMRLQKGLPDGSRDMIIERAISLECGLEDLHAISWTKGCYMGQELTARTKHRGLVRKRYFPVEFEGSAPEFGTKISQGEDDVGEIYSSNGALALARLKLEALLKEEELSANHQPLKVLKPEWMPYDEIMKDASQNI
ncbi:MAG: folate-binding protein YgfZ [Candidatus Paracaedimonas acanthamoebae]|uniref:Folate-binding protein YgfZ n=1 Tax=Candidatus Paracaedimonas acanthamoebae TaxID=244581 RepID=A0A8J7Q196_9PROT|nr:folate-binding protein YgfZ [Candidatus Paracaedimonas acanthamoebae]